MAFDAVKMGGKLQQLRREKSAELGREVTQAEAARVAGVGEAAYSTYERGASQPTVERAWRLADWFGVTLDELAGRR